MPGVGALLKPCGVSGLARYGCGPLSRARLRRFYATSKTVISSGQYLLCYERSEERKQRTAAPDGRRRLFTEAIASIPTPLIPPLAFAGFLVSLWVYKCVMLVIFQNKIIYMPGLPPGARRERIEDYSKSDVGVEWHEQRIKSRDGTDISLVIGSPALERTSGAEEVVILYFQGNGSSIPPRLPDLSKVLSEVQATLLQKRHSVRVALVVLSYRGYWTSEGSPSQAGIELDALAALDYVHATHTKPRIVLWGQSLGACVAATLLATDLQASKAALRRPGIEGLILETPFLSLRAMLVALYPQKWLPYRYLYPFLRSHWDSGSALQSIATDKSGQRVPVLFVNAAKDELVPAEQSSQLVEMCTAGEMDVRVKKVAGALHTEATHRREGRAAIVEFMEYISSTKHR